MNNVQAIFAKHAIDMTRNLSVLVMFIIFPLVAFVMTEFAARGNPDIPDTMFTAMMAGIFIGMGLIQSACGVIAEDRENRSLRFLVIAGVKPSSYLMGIGGVIFSVSILTSLAFAWIGGFTGMELVKFMAVMLSCAIASIILGAIIGIFSKNQQSATAMSMPFAMVLGFGPLISRFNEQAERVMHFLYTQQLSMVISDYSLELSRPLIIIWLNIAVLAAVFAVAYSKKGLRS